MAGSSKSQKPDMETSPEHGEADVAETTGIHARFQNQLMRGMVESTPMGHDVRVGLPNTDKLRIPDLSTLSVVVPAPPPIGEEDLLAHFDRLTRDCALQEPKPAGAVLEHGDRVMVSLIGYSNGQLIPFSVREDLNFYLEPPSMIEGLIEGLIGQKVGDNAVLEVTLPEIYPVANLCGQRVVFAVQIKAAASLTPIEPNDPAQLALMERGETLEEVFQHIVEELEEQQTEELIQEGTRMVLQQLVKKARPIVSETLVSEEIQTRWQETEGRFMAAQELPPEEQEFSLNAWLHNAEMRADAKFRLQASVTLRAIGERERIVPTNEEMKTLLREVAKMFELSFQDTKQALSRDPATRSLLVDKYMHLRLVNYVVSQASITFEGADEVAASQDIHDPDASETDVPLPEI